VDKNMSEEMDVTVTKRTARFTVDALSFTTLTAGESEDFVSR